MSDKGRGVWVLSVIASPFGRRCPSCIAANVMLRGDTCSPCANSHIPCSDWMLTSLCRTIALLDHGFCVLIIARAVLQMTYFSISQASLNTSSCWLDLQQGTNQKNQRNYGRIYL